MRTREIQVDNDFVPRREPQKQSRPTSPFAEKPSNPFDEMEKEHFKHKNPLKSEEITKPEVNEPKPKDEKEEDKPVDDDGDEIIARTSAPSDLGPDWVRQDLPSHCIPYPFNDVFLRTLTVRALSTLHAAHVNRSFTLLLDGLNHCINIDIRDLTPADLFFIMHWVRNNSYPKSPLKIKYTTRYGNEIEIGVKQQELKITECKMTRDEYAEWQEKGICFATVRDMELMMGRTVPVDVRWMVEYAQYVQCDISEDDYHLYTQKKMDRLEELGTQIIGEIDAFTDLIAHGIQESVEVVDPKFEPIAAAEYFEENAKHMLSTLELIDEDDRGRMVETILEIGQAAEEMLLEAKDLRQSVEAGKPTAAKKEVVAVKLTATDFFPNLR